MKINIKEIAKICDGEIINDNDIECTSFSCDTRTIKEDSVYIGIVGNKYDGNSFYKEAFLKGAKCVILNKSYFLKNNIEINKPIILVEDTTKALYSLAQFKRNITNIKYIGITGSVGKTSTKDIIYSVLSKKYKTYKTEKNYNNNIGVPISLLKINNENVAVIEMGMNHLGEINELSKLIKPNVGVITNIGTSHIGLLGSRENIFKAKLEITNGLKEDGILIINNDDDLLHNYYINNNKNKILTIGINNQSDFKAYNVSLNENDSIFMINYKNNEYEVFVPIPGLGFVYNALVAFALGTIFNVDIKDIIDGIKNCSITKKRLEIINKKDYTIINDSYNASFDSMKLSLEVLNNRSEKRKIAVLGDMLELGTFSEDIHKKVGKIVASKNIDLLITVGITSKYIASGAYENGMDKSNIYLFDNNKEVLDFLKNNIRNNDVILFKASNRLNLSEIVDNL